MKRPGHRDPRAPSSAVQSHLFAAKPSTVLIVDDHELLRLGLRLMIDAEPDLEVCGEVASEANARQMITRHQPAVLVVDLSLQEGNGLDLVKWVTKHHPRVKCIVSTMHDEKIYGERALRAGACGFVSKSAPATSLLQAIRQVLAGEFYFSEYLHKKVLEAMRSEGQPALAAIDRLSDREVEVLRFLGTGMASSEIAAALHISTSTVDTYRERLKSKLNLSSAVTLIHYATRWVLEQR